MCLLYYVLYVVSFVRPVVPEVEEGATSASFSVLDPGVYEIIDQTVPGAFMIDVLGNLHLSGHVTMDYESVPVHHVVYR